MLKRLLALGLYAALAGVLLCVPAAQTARALPPDTSWVSIDRENVTDAELSHVDNYFFTDKYRVWVCVDYSCQGAGYKIKCQIYDEGLGQTVDALIGPNQTVYTTTQAGTGTVWFYYTVTHASDYGQYIAAEYADRNTYTPDYAWATVTIQNAAAVVSNDGAWIADLLNTAP